METCCSVVEKLQVPLLSCY